MDNYQKTIGNLGEKIAKQYLSKRGHQIISSNFTIRGGQIDLIASLIAAKKQPKQIIFFEVKTRTNQNFGQAEENISSHQKQTLLHTAQVFLAKHQLFHCYWQFDLISINLNTKTQPILAQIKHLENIFAE